MMHKLQFNVGQDRLFDLMYEGFVGIAKPGTREEHAATKGVLKKFRAISTERDEVIPPYRSDDPLSPKRRAVKPDAFELLEESEWAWLCKTLNSIQTPAIISDLVMDMFDKLDNAPKGDAKELMAPPVGAIAEAAVAQPAAAPEPIGAAVSS